MDRIVLVQAARGRELSNSVVRDVTGLDRVEATRSLQRLRDAGLLVQHGQRGGAVYTLAESWAPAAEQRLSLTALENLVLEEAGRHPVRNADIREVTGLDRTEARSLLARMVADGRLRQRGVTRGTVYIRGRR